MARPTTGMTVAQLEQALHKRKAKLELLLARRTKLQRSLEKVQGQILVLAGRGASEDGDVRRRRRRRPKNEKSLKAYVLDVLGRNKKGLSISELDQKVQEAGYKTRSKN